MPVRFPIKSLQHDPIVVEPGLRANGSSRRKANGDVEQEDDKTFQRFLGHGRARLPSS
jgi:hypothetical protein